MCWVCDGVRLEAAPGQLTAMKTDVPRVDGMIERGKKLQRSWDGFGVIAEFRQMWSSLGSALGIFLHNVSFSCINRKMFVLYSVQITRKFLGLIAFKHSSLTLDLNISLLYLVI